MATDLFELFGPPSDEQVRRILAILRDPSMRIKSEPMPVLDEQQQPAA